MQVIEVDLGKLFADSAAGTLKAADAYQRVCGTTPPELGAGGDMALDGGEEWVYFRVGREAAAKHLAADAKIEKNFGPRNMGAGPSGIAAMNVHTGAIKYVVSVGFQIGHIQANPWVPGEIVFCWETGGKSPQRTWTVLADGSGLRPLYPESAYEWVTHEAISSKNSRQPRRRGSRHGRRRRQSGSGSRMGTFGHPGKTDGPRHSKLTNA
jgi:oligogalacturonide lyase